MGTAHLHPERDFDCSYGGYGGPEELPESRFEMNLNNGNAAELLRTLGLEDSFEGSADRRDVLCALALHGGLISVRYLAGLERIAKMAVKYDRSVIWS